MAKTNKFVHFKTRAAFFNELARIGVTNPSVAEGNDFYNYIVFIKETGEIYTHGTFYNDIGVYFDMDRMQSPEFSAVCQEYYDALDVYSNKTGSASVPILMVATENGERKAIRTTAIYSTNATGLGDYDHGYYILLPNPINGDRESTTGFLLTPTDMNIYSLEEPLYRGSIVDNLNSDMSDYPLSAKQGLVLSNMIDQKQDLLVSGDTIKSINGSSILGSGDLKLGTAGIVDDLGTLEDIESDTFLKYSEQTLTSDQQDQVMENLGVTDYLTACGFNKGYNLSLLWSVDRYLYYDEMPATIAKMSGSVDNYSNLVHYATDGYNFTYLTSDGGYVRSTSCHWDNQYIYIDFQSDINNLTFRYGADGSFKSYYSDKYIIPLTIDDLDQIKQSGNTMPCDKEGLLEAIDTHKKLFMRQNDDTYGAHSVSAYYEDCIYMTILFHNRSYSITTRLDTNDITSDEIEIYNTPTSLKTINGQNIVGEGDITIEGGSGNNEPILRTSNTISSNVDTFE